MVASNDLGKLAREADEIYARLRPTLEPQHAGKFIVINLDTGEYELDASDVLASKRAVARWNPNRLFSLRVGERTTYRIGAA